MPTRIQLYTAKKNNNMHNLKTNKLFRNAFNLMLSSGIISLFGFVFWIVVARNYDSHDVGLATTLISSALLISLLGQAGFDTTFIRFLPKSENKSAYINTGIIVSGVASVVIAIVFCLGSPLFSSKLSFLASNPAYIALFVVFVVFATWNTLTNAALIAYRKTIYVLVIDLLFSAIKLSLPFVISSGNFMTIFILVAIAQIVNVALSVFVLMRKFGYRPAVKVDFAILKETKRYSLGVYTASILNLLPDSLLPIIIINKLGAPDAAYFYIAFAIANLVYTIAFAITQVLLAETSHDENQFAAHARRGMLIAVGLLTPAIIIVIFAAPYLLELFGKTYAGSGLETLRIMVLSGFFVLMYSFLGFYYKHTKKLLANIIMTAVNAVSIVVLSSVMATKYGLPGVGWAWLIGTVISVIVGALLFVLGRKKAVTLPKTPSKILITHVYSEDNKGDAALLSVLVNDVRRTFPKAQLTILTLDSVAADHTFEGIPVKKSFMFYALNKYHNRPMTLLYSLFVMSSTVCWAYCKRTCGISLPLPKRLRDVCKTYYESDLILPVGGGYLRSQKKGIGSLLNVAQLLHPFMVANLLGKPTILYTQSIGPFVSRSEKWLVKHVLNKNVSAAIIREEVSLDLLKRIGVTIPLHRSVDSGFAFNPKITFDLRKKLHVKRGQLLFGMTARQWLSKEQQRDYERALADTINYIVEKYNAKVVLIPQVTAEFHKDDDRLVHNRIAAIVKYPASVIALNDNMSHAHIKAAYDSLDFLIGTRFYSVIFALTSRVPALAIEYEHKTGGIMHDLNLDKWVIKMEKVNSKLLQDAVDRLIAQSNTYKAHLNKILPAYIKDTEQPILLVKQAYEKHVR